MQPRSTVPKEPSANGHLQPALASGQRSELAAIALLRLVFAWPVDEQPPARLSRLPE